MTVSLYDLSVQNYLQTLGAGHRLSRQGAGALPREQQCAR
jgi:hypothetical protein